MANGGGGGDVLRAQALARIDQRGAFGQVLAGAPAVGAGLDAGGDGDLCQFSDLVGCGRLAVLLHDDGVGARRHRRAGEDACRGFLRQRFIDGMARRNAHGDEQRCIGVRVQVFVAHRVAVDG